MQPYFGSNWIRLSYKATSYLLDYIRMYPEFVSFFKTVHIPDEHFFHTILFNASEEDRGKIEEDCLTYIHWDRAPELYHIPLGMSDLPNLLHSGKLFARKFDSGYDFEILDELDRQ